LTAASQGPELMCFPFGCGLYLRLGATAVPGPQLVGEGRSYTKREQKGDISNEVSQGHF
jgi:hypothetical protein